ncbi:MAG: LPS biosynthesis protein WbpP [Candidatus Omnitrophica bacterium CG12_big_fil_rev_8_21_14_0_65_43_15]|uniref:LPS biosynthesis protein WbpP n=1 Tax=Candidatus Taenaricola geysiri TaxID=1974752 RepID=A0A2J0LT34_9BACT|nr:MAG: LPS biosynthesis protein WbpP [Candidatus Omnitrophica bacterium CG12_big_fil_rev_8_21_14_0_65_43_15]
MSKFLVTGGAGFIGSHIAGALVRDGNKVVVLDDFSSGRRENLSEIMSKIELIEGDIRDKKAVAKAVSGVDYVLHQAALRSVPKSMLDPQAYNDVNITGILNILQVAKEAKVKRVVFASSSSIYGETDKLPQKEDAQPLLISPYALSKLAGEYYCRIFSLMFGIEAVSLRYFNVFGPRQSLENEYAVVIPKFITCILKDEQPPIHGDGKQTRDFTYVENVVQANLKAVTAKGAVAEVFNVACGKAYSVLDIVTYVNKILKKSIKPKLGPIRPGDVKDTLADISKAKRILGFDPKIGFEEGLQKTVDYFRKTAVC